MRPIDADALIEKCGDWYVEEGTESGFIGTLKNLLSTMPTVQHEKTQLSKGGTTSDLISKTEVVEHLRRMLESTVPNTDYDGGYIDGIEFGISTVSTMPPAQSQSTTGQLNDSAQSTNLIDRQAAIDGKIIIQRTNGVEIYYDEAVPVGYLKRLPSVQPEPDWIPIERELPRDGSWNIFTDGKNISVERYKADAIDHFFPAGRWFELEDVIAWMPLPKIYKPNK